MRIVKERAVHLLNQGDVVALPTETVYGLAASMAHPHAVEKIFQLKKRPQENPLIIHLGEKESLFHYTAKGETPLVRALIEAFWPGPLTLVLPIKEELIGETVRAGLKTAAFRLPSHPVTRAILQQTGPLVMPSANLSGKPSATEVEHVEEDFGSAFPVVEGEKEGEAAVGLESTILVEQEGKWCIARLGALPAEAFLPVLQYVPELVKMEKNKRPLCPGQLYRHYAPKTHLTLTTSFPAEGTLLGFRERVEQQFYPPGCRVLTLGSLSNPYEVAENLFSILRQLDSEKVDRASIDSDFPRSGVWLTIYDRLAKAACGKEYPQT